MRKVTYAMSPDDDLPTAEDPDMVAERIVAALRFLLETAQASNLTYLVPHLTRCVTASEGAYVKERRRRFRKRANGHSSGNGR